MLSALAVTVKVCAILLAAGWLFTTLTTREDARWLKARPLRLMLFFYAFGLLSPSVWLVYAAEVLAIPLLSRSRGEAVAMYIATGLSLPGLNYELGALGIYVLLLDKWLFAAAGLLLAVLLRPPVPGPRGRWNDLPFFLLLLLEMLQARGLSFTVTTRALLGPTLTLAVPYFAISRSLLRPEDVRRLLLTIAFYAFCLSAVAVFEAKSGFLVYEAISRHYGLRGGELAYGHSRSGFLRAAGSFPESITFGIFLVLSLVATLGVRDAFRNEGRWLVALVGIGVGLLAANTRSGLLSLVVALLAFDFYRRRYASFAIKAGALAMIAAIALMASQFYSPLADMLGVNGGSHETMDYRHQLFTRGLQEILRHPLFGMSQSDSLVALNDLRQGEGIVDIVNGYIGAGLIAGLPGMAALLGAFLLTCAGLLRARNRLRHDARLMRLGAFAFAVISFTILTTFTGGFGGRNSIMTYVVFAFSAAIAASRRGFGSPGAAPDSEAAAPPAAAERPRTLAPVTAR